MNDFMSSFLDWFLEPIYTAKRLLRAPMILTKCGDSSREYLILYPDIFSLLKSERSGHEIREFWGHCIEINAA